MDGEQPVAVLEELPATAANLAQLNAPIPAGFKVSG